MKKNELKTLKDYFEKAKRNPFQWELFIELRKEAIKWIKEITKDGINRTPSITITGKKDELIKAVMQTETSLVADWIKHFFNIKEEDLK